MSAKLCRLLPPPTLSSLWFFFSLSIQSLATIRLKPSWAHDFFKCTASLVIPTHKRRIEQILMDYIEFVPWIQNYIKNRLHSKCLMWKGRICSRRNLPKFIYQCWSTLWLPRGEGSEANYSEIEDKYTFGNRTGESENQKMQEDGSHVPTQSPFSGLVQLNDNSVESPRGSIHSRRMPSTCSQFSFKFPEV